MLQSASSGLPGEAGWRWCKRCQGLAFGKAAIAGPCSAPPAGGQHDFSGSDDYLLARHSVDHTYALTGALTKGRQFEDAARGLTVKVGDIAADGGGATVAIVKT
jgi:hypothetical protein